MKKGIDISKWNGKIDFLQVKKSGVDFVIIREGYRKQIDPRFLEYVEESKKAGLVVLGIYHFLYTRSVEDAILEARSAVSNAKKAGLNPDEIIIFSDYEYDTVDDAKEAGILLTKEDCNAHVQVFCAEVTRLGYKAGIYTNLDYYRHYYTAETISPYPVWLADYTDGPDFSCIVQQYTSKGSVPGISGNVDMNYYYGDFKMEEKYTDNSVIYESLGTSKDIATVAREVISGLWGNGDKRKEALERNGLNYAEVQAKVNEILNGPAKNPAPTVSSTKKVETTCYAKSKDSSLAGTYVTTADLYCRNDAGTNKKALCMIPKGTKVNNFGFYTTFNGIKWLLIQFTLNGVQYTGFSSSVYLKR